MVDSNGNAYHTSNTEAFDTEKEVNQQTGLEVDHTQDGLITVSDTAGLETLPAENSKGAIPQTNYEGPEKETWNLDDKEIISPDESNELQRQSGIQEETEALGLSRCAFGCGRGCRCRGTLERSA